MKGKLYLGVNCKLIHYTVFSSSLVNGFDLTFMVIYAVYLSARIYGFYYDDPDALRLGANWLAVGKSCLMMSREVS